MNCFRLQPAPRLIHNFSPSRSGKPASGDGSKNAEKKVEKAAESSQRLNRKVLQALIQQNGRQDHWQIGPELWTEN